MNTKQIRCMWIGIVIITLMSLCPPWIGRKNHTEAMAWIGRHPIFKQPTYKSSRSQTSRSYTTGPDGNKILKSERTYYPRSNYYESSIDFNMLFLQMLVVFLITTGAVLTVGGYRGGQVASRISRERAVVHCVHG